MNYEDLAHLMWVKQNNQEDIIDMENLETNKKHIPKVLEHLENKLREIDNYLCAWFENLPSRIREEIVGNDNMPDFMDYTLDDEGTEAYNKDVEEYLEGLYSIFSNSSLDIKLNDFKRYATKYADHMSNNWDFIGNLY